MFKLGYIGRAPEARVSYDNMKTEMFGHRRFLSPVETAAELPKTEAKSGFLCLVTSEASIYELVDGAWRKWVSEKGPVAPDP